MRALTISAGFAAALLSSVAIPSAALAQSAPSISGDLSTEAQGNFARDRNVAVRERPHPEYEAAGIRLGGFMAYPRLEADIDYDDNIYAVQAGRTHDTIWRLKPEVNVASNWSRHYLRFTAGVATNGYSSHSSENTTDWNLGATGGLDFAGRSQLYGGLSTARITEPRTSSSSAVGGFGPSSPAKPVTYNLYAGDIGWTKEFNRLKLGLRGDLAKFDYHDVPLQGPPAGQILDEDVRDRIVSSLQGRADYAVSPATALFVQVTGNERKFRLAPPLPQAKQDSTGYEALAGVNFELGHLMRGEIGAGFLKQNYKAAALKDVSGFGFRSKLEWFPSQLTTVTLNSVRSVEDSGVVNGAGLTGGYLLTDSGVRVDHELMRNVVVGGSAGFSRSEYKQINRTDNRTVWSLSATYLVNRRVGVNAGFTSLHQDSHGTAGPLLLGNKFTDNKFGASLILQF